LPALERYLQAALRGANGAGRQDCIEMILALARISDRQWGILKSSVSENQTDAAFGSRIFEAEVKTTAVKGQAAGRLRCKMK